MKTGDQVKFIHRKEAGIIAKVISKDTVEVDIDDGFTITARKDELIVIKSPGENNNLHTFDNTDKPLKNKSEATDTASSAYVTQKQTGFEENVYLVCTFSDDSNTLYLHIFNNSSYELLLSVDEQSKKKQLHHLYAGHIPVHNIIKISKYDYTPGTALPPVYFQLIFFAHKQFIYREPLTKKLHLKPAHLLNQKKHIPLLEEKGLVFPLIDSQVTYSGAYIRQNMAENKLAGTGHKPGLTKPAEVVDLHAEKLTANPEQISDESILDFQMKHFRQALDNAIAFGMREITFIHGVGNGILKAQIHQSLRKNHYIKSFHEARKEKFGYGATHVKLK